MCIRMSRRKIRIIRSKGRFYVQKVVYKWDSTKKRGITIVLEHLGPLEPLTSDRYSREDLKDIRLILRKQNQMQSTKTKQVALEEKQTGKLKEQRQTVFPPLTPPDEIIDSVMKIILNSTKAMSRDDTFKTFSSLQVKMVSDKDAIKKQIGFALTILERKGLVKRLGTGKRGDPYSYFIGNNSG